MKRGCVYHFDLSVHDGTKQVDEMELTVQVPSVAQWERNAGEPTKLLTDEAVLNQKLAEYRKMFDTFVAGTLGKAQLLTEAEQKIKGSGLSDVMQELIMARIEEWIARADDK